jgi:DNA gyrase/topoisomerase IV subunit A
MAIRFNEDEVRPMGLVAAGVNSIKLGVGDEVVGCEILPGDGDLFAIASDGKAKRMAIKDFPVQGRYGRGVILWDMPAGVKLAGLAFGKVNAIVTLHLLKAAAKQARLDEAPLRKRSATRGEAVVDVKPGDSVIGLTTGWTFSRFIDANQSATTETKKSAPKAEKSKPVSKGKPSKSKKKTAKR